MIAGRTLPRDAEFITFVNAHNCGALIQGAKARNPVRIKKGKVFVLMLASSQVSDDPHQEKPCANEV